MVRAVRRAAADCERRRRAGRHGARLAYTTSPHAKQVAKLEARAHAAEASVERERDVTRRAAARVRADAADAREAAWAVAKCRKG